MDHRSRVNTGNPLVDPGPAVDRVRALVAKGMPVGLISRAASISERTARGLLDGYLIKSGGRKVPTARITMSVREAILAVEFEEPWSPKGFSGQRFREIRESRNISRKGLGELTGLCPETFQYWETGRSLPTRQKNMDLALTALQADWQDVCTPPVAEETELDEYVEVYSADPLGDLINDYPCCVCGNIFRSRALLAQHPHPRKKASA